MASDGARTDPRDSYDEKRPWDPPDPWQCEWTDDQGHRCVFGKGHTVGYHLPKRQMPDLWSLTAKDQTCEHKDVRTIRTRTATHETSDVRCEDCGAWFGALCQPLEWLADSEVPRV